MAAAAPRHRGLADSRKALSSWRFVIAYMIGGAVVTLIAGLIAGHWTDDSLWLAVIPVGVLIAWAIFIPAILIGWNILRAPYRMLREAGPTDRVTRAIEGLSAEERAYLVNHGERLANGVTNLEIDSQIGGQLTVKGIAEVVIVPIPDPYSGAPSSTHEWKLTAFGNEVVRALRQP